MSYNSNGRVPKYRRHKSSGQAIVTLPDGYGGRKDYLRGPYNTDASRQEYKRLISWWMSKMVSAKV